MDDVRCTVRTLAGCDFPDVQFEHEFLALTDPNRYAIEDGSIKRSARPLSP